MHRRRLQKPYKQFAAALGLGFWLALLPIMTTLHAANAAELPGISNYRLSGFGSIGAVTSDSDDLGFRRDFADAEATYSNEFNVSSLSLLGLQANATVNDELSFVAQAVLRNQSEQNVNTILRIASLSYSPSASWQMRLGRNSQRIYMLSDSRNVGFTNLWTMPVSEFYAPMTYSYLDGVDATYSTAIGSGHLSLNAAFGRSIVTLEDKDVGNSTLEFNSVGGLNVEFQKSDWLTRFSWAYSSGAKDWDIVSELQDTLLSLSHLLMWDEGIQLAEDLNMENKPVTFISAGLDFDDGHLNVTTEAAKFISDADLIPSTNSAYLSIGKHISSLTPFFLISFVDTTDDYSLASAPPAPLTELAATTIELLNNNYDQKSISLGLRWNLNFNASLKAQWDHKFIEQQGIALWFYGEDGQRPEEDKKINIFSLRLDFIF